MRHRPIWWTELVWQSLRREGCAHSWSYDLLLRNIAEQLIEKGLASVVRHRRDDEDRSPEYDKLMAAEQAYVDNTIPPDSANSFAVH